MTTTSRGHAHPAPAIGTVLGGWTVIGEASPSPEGRTRAKVQCNGCKATCVRVAYDLASNKVGCARCRNAKYVAAGKARLIEGVKAANARRAADRRALRDAQAGEVST